MKKPFLCSFLLIITLSTFAQNDMPKIYPNGYIYDESTMNKLTHIVDSLNIEYNTSNINPTFCAKEQTVGHFIRLETGDIKAAKKDMDNRISFTKFKKKYPDAIIEENTLFIKSSTKNNDGQKFIGFSQWGELGGYRISLRDSTGLQQEFKNTWVYDYWAGNDLLGEAIAAFYFPDDFESPSIPEKYARMVSYTNFLMPVTTKYKKDARFGNDAHLQQDWKTLPIDKQCAILDTMRSIKVFGCGMSNRPRIRATNFALLSAEVTNWEVFLPAHLDMLIHRGQLVAGGKYAKGTERGTYIHELEALDINVTHLLLGMFLRIENPMPYYYSPRIAWALSELENKVDIEQAMLDMITDKELDGYNRLIMFHLFGSYTRFIPDEEEQKMAFEKLDIATKKLPKYSQQIVKKYIKKINNKY